MKNKNKSNKTYDSDKLFEQAKEAILKHNLLFIEDIIALIPCSKPTFYAHFPVDSDRLNELKEMLDLNKVNIKVSIREKLWQSNKAAELLALYRLICTPEEHRLLNQTYVDSKETKEIKPIEITVRRNDKD